MEPNRRQINKKYPQAILKDVFCFIRVRLWLFIPFAKLRKTSEKREEDGFKSLFAAKIVFYYGNVWCPAG
ncbi:hypothetical protein HMPREF9442_01116 [Paraprevotella xylaniphila YIT 11841]|uniref:Uncharacterized protein n=1 Tax=Paraprevotella xylaniphila YIT 11841 TaxID=762982 RepID=F3QSF8_9BACT|nr:hypothetical protein HMPREF9442_01116 [Paraprevotella xylaniphila YIT 11841]